MSSVENELRTLVLMRHAKAAHTGASDIERQLTADGRADAVRAGEWLRDAGVVVDHALVSAATRTRETWEHVKSGAGVGCEADVDPSLYQGGPETVLDVVRLVPDEASTVLVVGHNPTVSQLAQLLSDGQGDSVLLEEMTRGFPPAALTVLQIGSGWSTLSYGDARVTGFHVARG